MNYEQLKTTIETLIKTAEMRVAKYSDFCGDDLKDLAFVSEMVLEEFEEMLTDEEIKIISAMISDFKSKYNIEAYLF